VQYRRVDICDAGAVSDLVRHIIADYGRLNGVIHSAGIISDNFIIKKSAEEFADVLAAKVAGTVNLDAATQHLPLDFFVLFSSLAGALGNRGQADYAAANGFLDAYAHYRNERVGLNQRHGHTLAINWPLWQQGGMRVDAAAEAMMRANTGMVAMHTETGVDALYRALASGLPQVLVMAGDAGVMARHLSPPARQELYSPGAEMIDDESLYGKIEQVLLETVSMLLKVKPDDLDSDTEFNQYGFDSITLTEFSNRLNREYELELAPTVFFEYTTIAGLGGYLLAEQRQAFEQKFALQAVATTSGNGSLALSLSLGTNERSTPMDRHSGMDAGTQAQGCESLPPSDASKQRVSFQEVTVRGAGYRHPCRYDDSGTNLCITMSTERGNPNRDAPRPEPQSGSGYIPIYAPEGTQSVGMINDEPVSVPSKNEQSNAVAVIGMSGRFPMADDLDAFWQNLNEGRDCISEIPADRWDWRALYGDPLQEAHKTHIKWGGFIADVDKFDPLFFGISPREARLMDPQQRLLMQYVWLAIEDAGYSPDELSGTNTAIFIGTANSAYVDLIRQDTADSYGSTGMVASLGPSRMSYFLNLHGPSEAIETACSSSLVAVHKAMLALQAGDCDIAIVGGINLILSPDLHISFDKAGMLCEDGRCKSFSAQADGYVRGEGVGMLVLKKLPAAEQAGDRIYGVIRASAQNHGGRANSLTAPNPKAQADLLKTAYTKAGIDPKTVGYIEAHGTGTELGDPIEINAMKTAFQSLYQAAGSDDAAQPHCAVGTVKTNIGHLEMAAGVAGMIKVLLQLKHKTLVKNLHCETVNPYIQLEGSPFYLLHENREWTAMHDGQGRAIPRRAGVSSFGFGGVNAHVVIEEYLPSEPVTGNHPVAAPETAVIVLSAKTEERLKAYAGKLLEFVSKQVVRGKMTPRSDKQARATEDWAAKLRLLLAGLLQVDETELDPDQDLLDYGFENIHRMRLLEILQQDYGIACPATAFLAQDSINALAALLCGGESGPELDLADLAYTLQTGRKAMEERLAVTAASLAELEQKLEAVISGRADMTGIYRGRAKPVRETLGDVDSLIDSCINEGRYDELSAQWVNGLAFDWNRLYGALKPARISAPTYPFATERYWLQEDIYRPEPDMPPTASNGSHALRSSLYTSVCGTPLARHSGRDAGIQAQGCESSQPSRASKQRMRFQKVTVHGAGYRHPCRYDDSGTNLCITQSGGAIKRQVVLSNIPQAGNPHHTTAKPTGISLLSLDVGTQKPPAQAFVQKPDTAVLRDDDVLDNLKSAMPEQVSGMIPTLNRTGYMLETLISYSQAFADYAGTCGGEVLDIGCAYGIASIAALEQGATVLAVDMAQQHLDILERRIADTARDRIATLRGVLPDVDFDDGRFAAIHASRIFHFLTPEAVQISLQKMLRWLKPGGKLFLVADTPYVGYWNVQAPDYEARKAAGDPWPGYIADVHSAVATEEARNGPLSVNPLDPDIVRRECVKAGFDVEKAGFEGSDIFPEFRGSDRAGIEHVGIIAVKPAPVHESAGPTMRNEILDMLRQSLADELQMAVSQIDDDMQFRDMGLNSISGVMWVTRINTHYGLSVRATEIYSHPSLNEFAAHVFKLAEKNGGSARGKAEPVPAACIDSRTSAEADGDLTPHSCDETPKPETGDKPAQPPVKSDAIAIIGMAGQFPKAKTLEQFWDNLAQGRDCISEIPRERWALDDYYDPDGNTPGKTDCKWMGALDDIDQFDPFFFNISPREAELMDPQQRLFLQACWHCIEDAGLVPSQLSGSQCGVFVGCAGNNYEGLITDKNLGVQMLMGGATSFLASRISYLLNLQGPSIAIDTACSSSLVAIANACDSLLLGNSDLALAGGVSVILDPAFYAMGTAANVFSRDGRCFTFDQRANGFVPSEGVGVVMLKRLDDAIRDGDDVYGVIRGWGINHDGRSNGITAPNAKAQTRLEQDIYRKYGVHPEGIQLIEAHGTGTKLGDPIEIEALTESFRAFTDKQNYCALGSVKSNIGHPLLAAGVAGVIKLLLALKHKQLPPTINYETLNEHIELDGTPFYINTRLADWPEPDNGKRRAAISSFGFSGTNAHLVIEEYPSGIPAPAQTTPAGPVLLVLSAKTGEQLRDYALSLAAYLDRHATVALDSLAYSLQTGRDEMNHRLALLAISRDDALAKLAAFADGAAVKDGYTDTVVKVKGAIADSEEGREFIEKLANKKSLVKLAELWVSGNTIDWHCLYPVRPARLRHGLPGYPFAKQRYWAPDAGPAQKNIVETVADAGETHWDGVSYLPRWEEQQAPEHKPTAKTQACVVLVFAEPAMAFVQKISDEYRRNTPDTMALIQIASSTAQASDGFWHCGIDDGNGFADCLAAYPVIDCVYFIAVDQSGHENLLHSQQANEIQLLRLLKALKAKNPANAFVDCYIVTLDNYRLDGTATDPCGAGLTGLAYAIAQSDHRFLVRNIDLCREDLNRPGLVAEIIGEAPTDRGDVVKLKAGRRYRQTFLKLDWADMAQEPALKIGGVYVILGGAGSVGRVITRCLLQKYQASVVWIGRTPADAPQLQGKIAAMAAFGKPPLYIQADATDLESLQQALVAIKRHYPKIDGAMFSGIVFDFENSIAQTTEAEFRRILDVKTLGGCHFYQVFAAEPLDFICYFSSGQAFSFSGASSLSAYAAGITFSDSFIQSVRHESNVPVGTINWGFWQSSLEETPLDYAINALSDEQGFACLERFTAALRRGYCSQVLCMNASEPVKKLMNASDDERVSFAPAGPYLPPAAAGQGRDEVVAELLGDPARNGLMQWLARLLFVQLRELSPDIKAGAAGTATAWFDNAGVLELYRRWWRQSLVMLAEYGYLQRQGAEFSVSETGRGIADKAAVWQAWQTGKALYLDKPETQALVRLLDDCLVSLPDILRGAVQATDVLFPGSAMEKVSGIYKNSAQVDYFNTVLAESAAAFVRQRLAVEPAARIRIIEIGAGTGGTTAMVLRYLRPFAAHIDEYGYTDISKAFLQHGETQYGGEYPFLDYRLWNIEQPPADQGIATGVYDLVIAANVLHATQDIRQTLRHAKVALHQHGLMLLNEISDTSLLSHLSFGLLKGWWLYRDPVLRMPGSPGLYPEVWRDVLEEEGFGSVLFPAQAAHGLGQQIIAAVSDGVVRRKIHAVAQDQPPVCVATSRPPVTAGVNIKDLVRRQIRGSLVQALKAPEGSIDNDVPFSDYGIDSILGVGFVKQVNEGLGITMNTAIIFDYATVNQLAAYVLQTYGKDLDQWAAVEPDEQLAEQFFSGELSVESLLDSVMLQHAPGFGVES